MQIAPPIEEVSPSAGPSSPSLPTQATLPTPQRGFTIYDAMLLGMTLVWAANPAAIKWALEYIGPLPFNALRFGLATLVPLALLLASREGWRWQKGDGPRLFLLGLIGHGLYQTFFILALDNTLAGNVALILSVNPAFVALFGSFFGYEKIGRFTWIGVALTLVGVGLVVGGSDKPLEFGSQLMGDLLMIVVTIMWALYTVLSQPLLKRYSPVKLNALTMPLGAGLLLAVASPSIVADAPSWASVPATAWLILAASALLAVSASYIIWYKGVQKLGATRTSVYSNLVPVLAALISFFILAEPLGWPFWAGMAFVLAGVSLARFGGQLLARVTGDG